MGGFGGGATTDVRCFRRGGFPFGIFGGGTGGSALCRVDGIRGIGKVRGDIFVPHNHLNDSLTINPDPKSPLSCTNGRFYQELRSRPRLA